MLNRQNSVDWALVVIGPTKERRTFRIPVTPIFHK